MLTIKISPQRNNELSAPVTIDGMIITIDGETVDLSEDWLYDDVDRLQIPHSRLNARTSIDSNVTVNLIWPYLDPAWDVMEPPFFTFSGEEQGEIVLPENATKKSSK